MLAAGMAIGVMAPFWVSWHHSHDKEHFIQKSIIRVVSLGICMSVLTFFAVAHLQNLNLKEICRVMVQPLSHKRIIAQQVFVLAKICPPLLCSTMTDSNTESSQS